MKKTTFLTIFLSLILVATVVSQSTLPNQELRAAWLATVDNLDWPLNGTLPEASKKQDLLSKLNNLKEAGFNVVYFQVRSEGDALYNSPYEPWSKYLTGKEGVAPNPYWDPLEFAIEEAHKLGMELHAWLNPYRILKNVPSDFTQKAVASENGIEESLASFLGKEYDANAPKFKGTQERDSLHVSNLRPDWILIAKSASSSIGIVDPGLQEVRDYTATIIADIVRRYDVDGIHFDDYFYPYSPNNMSASAYNNALDDSSFALDPRGFTNKSDWRRNNVEIFMTQINDTVKAIKPWVKFGISPFGIYRNGVPSGITGTDSYQSLYTDPLKWAENGDVDYLMPQLYWKFGGGQDFTKLANWWAIEITNRSRHLYVGHGAYKTDLNTYWKYDFSEKEIPRQIQFTRDNNKISGSAIFRTKNITTYASQGLRDSLVTNYYRKPAIVPTMNWLDTKKAETPINLVLTPSVDQSNKFTISWDRADEPPAKAKPGTPVDTLLNYMVYRIDSPTTPDVDEVISNPENRIGLTGITTFTDIAEPSSEGNYYYVVTAITRNGVESDPSEALDAGVVVSTDEEATIVDGYKLKQNYPNPFNPTTNITFNLGKSGVALLKVYDVLGREIATIVSERLAQGEHTFTFNASALSSGVYIYQLKANGVVLTRKLTLIK